MPPAVHKALGYLLVLGGVAHSVAWWIAYGRAVRTGTLLQRPRRPCC